VVAVFLLGLSETGGGPKAPRYRYNET